MWYKHGMLFGFGFQKEHNPHQLRLSVTTLETQNKVNGGCYEQAVTQPSKANLQAG